MKLGGEELEFNQLKKAIDHISHFLFRPRIHLTGGEPLLYKDFIPLIEYLKKKRFVWSMTTNGLILERYATPIVDYQPRHLNISIDGPKDIHNDIRGDTDSFQNAMRGIQALRKVREEKGYDFPKITVNCAIQEKNYRYLEETVQSMEDSGADSLTLEHFFFDKTNEWSMDMARKIDVDCLKQQMIKIKTTSHSIPVDFFPRIKFSDIVGYYTDISYDFGNSCIAPWLIVRVEPNGNVDPCYQEVVFGNLVEERLKDIWNNDRSRNFRMKLKTEGIFKGTTCDRCCHRQYYIGKTKTP